jgi:hypothetical protein
MDKDDHLTKEERVAYWERTLAPATLLAASEHLQTCTWCREQVLQARPAADAADPVGYEDLVSWLDNDLDPISRREMVGRLAASASATEELAGLAQFRDEMNRLPPRDYALDEETNPGGRSWILPIAAGLALGFAFLWWSSAERNAAGGIALRDAGRQIIVRQNGAVPARGALPPDLQAALREASLGRFHPPAVLASLQPASETLAGAPPAENNFAVVEPVGTVVETTRPTLRWKAAPNATGYRINLAPKGGGEVVTSPVLGAALREWQPNESLEPGETYDWEVEALRDGEMIAKVPAPPAPEARFAILPNERREELERLRRQFGDSHLLMGVAYAETGLVSQARAQFEKLAEENPQSEFPKKLLASLTNR